MFHDEVQKSHVILGCKRSASILSKPRQYLAETLVVNPQEFADLASR